MEHSFYIRLSERIGKERMRRVSERERMEELLYRVQFYFSFSLYFFRSLSDYLIRNHHYTRDGLLNTGLVMRIGMGVRVRQLLKKESSREEEKTRNERGKI